MRVVSVSLVVALAASPTLAIAQDRHTPIRASAERAVAAAAAVQQSDTVRQPLFWSGLALGIAGITTAVLGVTAYRVEDTSTGNAPNNAYQTCVAQKKDPIYASSRCDALKGKNRALLWSGVAIGAVGATLIIGSTHTSAELSGGAVRLLHTIRF